MILILLLSFLTPLISLEAIEEYTVLLEERLEERAVEFNLTIQGLQKNLSTYMPMSTDNLGCSPKI
jgi:hypothetical protein